MALFEREDSDFGTDVATRALSVTAVKLTGVVGGRGGLMALVEGPDGIEALQEILRLYANAEDPSIDGQIKLGDFGIARFEQRVKPAQPYVWIAVSQTRKP